MIDFRDILVLSPSASIFDRLKSIYFSHTLVNEITIILIVSALLLYAVGLFVTEKKPFQLFGGILGTCSLAALFQDSSITEVSLMCLMAIILVYVTLMSLAGAITRLEVD